MRPAPPSFAAAASLLCCWCVTLLGGTVCAHPVFPTAAGTVTVSVVATTDLHGHLEALPWLGGHLANLRAARASDGGVLLVDSGDMFQGTLESNLGEGAPVVRAYGALGYAAVAIGNHEFDFGPAGPAHVPLGPGDDPRGALKQRAAEARFPFLAANVREVAGPPSLSWTNVRPWTIVTVAGAPVGLVGVTTSATPRATHPRNFAGLEALPLVESITAAARAARRAGAVAVVVAAHAGGHCTRLEDPDDLRSCDPDEEIFRVARALPPGLVDAIAAGHTHQGVAHRVAGVAVVQAFSGGRAFARVDLRIDLDRGRVVRADVFPPRSLCDRPLSSFSADACHPPPYEGRPVRFDAAISAVFAAEVAGAAARRALPLGITLGAPFPRAELEESPLGNLTADLMRALEPRADVAFINGGSLRSDLPAGPLRYGALYEAFPFDDGLATITLDAGRLGEILARNLLRAAGILSLSGIRATARCAQGRLAVSLFRADGSALSPGTPLLAVTNGYLASGGDGLLAGLATGEERGDLPLRDAFAALLSARGGELRPADLAEPRPPRLEYPRPRPVRCPAAP
jgi:2',3'-cyclic-nucleotide 2'-phosphodiesterase (5'-nucleotidase family)